MSKGKILNVILMIFGCWWSMAALAQGTATNHLVTCISQSSVDQVTDALTKTLQDKGIKIFAHINFSADASAANLTLADEQLIIFGNPKAGTLLMQENPAIGAFLPLKILAWKNADGKTIVAYESPTLMAKHFQVKKADAVIAQMNTLMSALTSQVCTPATSK